MEAMLLVHHLLEIAEFYGQSNMLSDLNFHPTLAVGEHSLSAAPLLTQREH